MIVERSDYGDIFQGFVPCLDSRVEEVQGLKSMILALGLSDRYMSKTVRDTSSLRKSCWNRS